MANKYLIHGAAFCGDGTSPAQASSDGGVGAWNNINVFTATAPAKGALVAGDSVFIQSKTAAGADLVITLSANTNIGSSAATVGAPIIWNIDDGKVWPGVSGMMTVTAPNHYICTVLNNNVINAALPSNLTFTTSMATWGPGYDVNLVAFMTCVTRNLTIDMRQINTNNMGSIGVGGRSTHYGLNIVASKNRALAGLFKYTGWVANITLYDPRIEILTTNVNAPLFGDPQYGGNTARVFGGEIFGPGAADNVPIFNNHQFGTGPSALWGTKFPRGMVLSNTSLMTYDIGHFSAAGADGIHGSMYYDNRCKYDSRSDGYYPTREAMLETSDAAHWSYKVFVHGGNQVTPATIAMSKLYSVDPAARTITVEVLWPETLPAPTKDQLSINLAYVDSASGQRRSMTTFNTDGTLVETSTALWSATTYGSVAFSRYRLRLTTPTAIKKDSEIFVTLDIFVSGVSQVNDILFVDPDITVT